MRQIVQNMKNGDTEVVEVPLPKIKPGSILVKTHASLVSTGTERMLVDFAEKNLIGKAKSRPDLFKQVIQKAQRDGILTTLESAFNRLDQPIVLGYSSAGTVVQVGSGINDFKVGDRVACAGGGHAVHAEYALIPKNLAAPIPDGVSHEEAAFATIGAIALNGIRLAQPQIGETTAVIGLGLLGLLTAQILKASGTKVIGLELDQRRIELARTLGIDAYSNEFVASNFQQLSGGSGFDHIFICADTKSDEPVIFAGQIAHDRGKVVAIGAVGMDIPRKPYYEKEITFIVSRSYGPGRYDKSYEEKGQDYPAGYVRWTVKRNLSAILDLINDQKVDVSALITHRFKIDEAQAAYQLLSGKSNEDFLGLIIEYPHQIISEDTRLNISIPSTHQNVRRGTLNVGVLGAGNYANAVFLPVIKDHSESNCFGIVSAKGLHAQQSGKKFGFHFASTNEKEIFENNEVDIAVILTQHGSHADLSAEALENNKHVYCEKPLAIDLEGLHKVISHLNKEKHPYLTVGFNRRFAPFTQKIKNEIEKIKEPIFANYRINAGYLPPDHWLHDPAAGGGRLIGEACHFIDMMIYLMDAPPVTVNTLLLPNSGKYVNDNFQITLSFSNGSIASIAYLANGSRAAGKEYLELFTAGKTIIMDDFRKLSIFGKGEKTDRALFKQDKGHSAAWAAFVSAIKSHSSPPIPYDQLFLSAYTVLACAESMQTGAPVNLQKFMNRNNR